MSTKTSLLQASEVYFHAYNRVVENSLLFPHERNYHFFMTKIEKYLDKSKLEMVAFCLMPSHYHFVLFQRVPEAVSEFISNVCNGYAKALNKQMNRTGHLFESKYKMKIVDETAYLTHLTRYVHMNPVAAGLVGRPQEWEFSSCREYCRERKSKIVSPEIVLSQFRNSDEYLEFMQDMRVDSERKIQHLLLD